MKYSFRADCYLHHDDHGHDDDDELGHCVVEPGDFVVGFLSNVVLKIAGSTIEIDK